MTRTTCFVREFGSGAAPIAQLMQALALVMLLIVALPTFAGSVTLAWDAVDSPQVTGYTVHYGTASESYTTQADAGPSTSATISGLTEGVTYYFAVTAYDASGNRSGYSNEVFTQIAYAPPAANFSASATSGVAPLAINFINGSTGTITLHSWTFGDGTTSNAVNPVKNYANPGVYSVSLTVSGPGGSDTQTRPGYITVVAGGADTTPPTAPASLTATPSGTVVDLSWPTSADNVGVTHYHVERCQGVGCTDFSEIGFASATSYRDSGLATGTTYRYRVRAADGAGNLGGYSPSASVTNGPVGDTTAPSAPSWVYAFATGSGSIALWWDTASDNVAVTGYRLERCEGAGCNSFGEIATGPGTFHHDTGLAGGTTYGYRVRAVDGAGNVGPYSPIAAATTEAAGDGTPPTAPGGLWAVWGSSGVLLGWDVATDNVGVSEYLIERCAGVDCTDFVQFATTAARDYVDMTAWHYAMSYRVRAVDAAGNVGPYSTVASTAP